MEQGISSNTRRELIGALSKRYRQANRSEKGRILDEFVKLTKCHRKQAIRVLNQGRPSVSISVRSSRRIYDEAVREALVAIWEAADRICGKRLRIVMPDYVEPLEFRSLPTMALDSIRIVLAPFFAAAVAAAVPALPPPMTTTS